jgi:RimJ/RimL family protein N-acetyltransferase
VVEHEGVEGGREVWGGEDDSSQVMVGDVNLFLFDDDAAGEAETTSGSGMRDVVGEVEIMIAQSSARGRGVGRRALSMFLRYVWGNRQSIVGEFGTSQRGADGDGLRMQLSYLRAKIDAGNDRSIALFRKVGFEMVSEEPNYFGEVEMRWNMDETKSDRIQKEIGGNGDCVVQYRIRDEETNDTN